MRQFAVSTLLVLLALGATTPPPALAQDLSASLTDREPRFLVASAPGAAPRQVDVTRTAVLARRIAVRFEDVTLDEALATISERSGLQLVYSTAMIPPARRVRLRADEITVAGALSEVLRGLGVDVLLSGEGKAVLVRRRPSPGEVPAQAGTIVGRVTDAKSGEGLAGADVLLEGTRWRATSGEDGRYRLVAVAPGSYTLTARRVGYAKQSRAVLLADAQELTVDVALEAVPTQLNEIVTTVTGEQRRVELGHVVGRINADSLVKEAPVSTLSELLNGRVPGLQVFQSQGTVGGEVKLQVRGPNSLLLSTEPILIVDGVRYATGAAPRPFASGPAEVEPTSPLNDLNPNDIASIEVVKGPSAATLYGTDAANGVIVVTTKRGQAGPARWNAYVRGATTEIPTLGSPDTYFGWTRDWGEENVGLSGCSLYWVVEGRCTQDSVTVLTDPLKDPEYTIFRSRPRWQTGLNVSGGRQDLRYFFSADFERAVGPIRMPSVIEEQLKAERGLGELPDEDLDPNAFNKTSLRANVTATLGPTAELRLNTGYVRSATRTLGTGGTSVYSDGAMRPLPGNPWGSPTTSPAQAFMAHSTERVDRFVSSANGQWRPAEWLVGRATVGLDLTSRNRYSLAPRGVYFEAGTVVDDRVRQLATTAELGATATARHGRFSSRTSVGVQYVRNLIDALSGFGYDLPPGGTSVGEAASVSSAQTYNETVTLGSYLEETVGLNERLFLTGALRLDGASAFGREYDAAIYPKVSVSWLVSDEPFLPRLPGVDELRVRYAYGASGQQAQPAWTLPTFSPTRTVLEGANTTVVDLVGLGNPHLRPERVREHELGFDATVLASRLQLGLTWYRRRTVDQIVSLGLPPGLGSVYTNLGVTTQHGFEAELTARVLDSRRLSWDVMLQHSLHRTNLVDLGGGVTQYSVNGGYVEGYPLGARFARPMLGFSDANGDGLIGPDEVQLAETPVYAGESTPPRSQTLTSVLGLFDRRLRLSVLLERRAGFTQLERIGYLQCALSYCRGIVDPSAPLLDQAKGQLAFAEHEAGEFLESGDFTRLREVTVALDLPAGITRPLRLRSATLSLAARNLALWTDFTGPDPESTRVTGAIGGAADGIPQGRSWMLRLDVGF